MSGTPTLVMIRACFFLLSLASLLVSGTDAVGAAPAPRVAVVIDDGPVPELTAGFLAVLAEHRVPATFGYIGKKVVAHPEQARAASAGGHEVVNHSFNHRRMMALTDDELLQEVQATNDAVREATGRPPRWFWPPFRERDERITAAVEASGLRLYPLRGRHLLSSGDANVRNDALAIRSRATTGIRDGTIITFHEWRQETLTELPAILTELKRQGCVFLTLSELAALPR